MTVSATDLLAGPFTPDGVATTFPFDFPVFSAGEVAVFSRLNNVNTPITSGFTLSGVGGATGSVVFTHAPSATLGQLFIAGTPSFLQDVSFEEEGPFLPTVLNRVHDRAVMRDLWLRDQLARTFTVPVGEAGFSLPAAPQRAGKLQGYAPVTGLPVMVDPVTGPGGAGAPGVVDIVSLGVVADGVVHAGQEDLLEAGVAANVAEFSGITGRALDGIGVMRLARPLTLKHGNLSLGKVLINGSGLSGDLVSLIRNNADANSKQQFGSKVVLNVAGDLSVTNAAATAVVIGTANPNTSWSPASEFDIHVIEADVGLRIQDNVEKVTFNFSSVGETSLTTNTLAVKLLETLNGSPDSVRININAANYCRLFELTDDGNGADLSFILNTTTEGHIAVRADFWVINDQSGKGGTYTGSNRTFNGTGDPGNAFFYFYQPPEQNSYADFAHFHGYRMIHHYGRSLYMRSLRYPTGDLILRESFNGRTYNNQAVSVPGPAYHVGRVVAGGSFRPTIFICNNQFGMLHGDDVEWSIGVDFGPAVIGLGNYKPIDTSGGLQFPTDAYAHHFYRGDRNSWLLQETRGGIKISDGIQACTIKTQATLFQIGYPVDLSTGTKASFTLLADGAYTFGEFRAASWVALLAGEQVVQGRSITDYDGQVVTYKAGRFRLGGAWRPKIKEITDASSDLNRDFREAGLQVGCKEDAPGGGAAAGQLFVAADKLSFGGQPTAADTITFNVTAPNGGATVATVITFRASGAGANEVNIGGNATATAAALVVVLNGVAAASGLTAMSSGTLVTLAPVAPGATIGLAKSGTYPALSNWQCIGAGVANVLVGDNAFLTTAESHIGAMQAPWRKVYDRLLHRLDNSGALNFDGTVTKSKALGLWLLGADPLGANTSVAALKSLLPANHAASFFYDATAVGGPAWTRKLGYQFLPVTLAFLGLPADGDTMTLNGYAVTFKTVVTNAATQCLIGVASSGVTAITAMANNLGAWINANTGLVGGALSTYNAGTPYTQGVTTILGNAFTFAKSGAYPTYTAPAYLSTTIDQTSQLEGTSQTDLLLVALPRRENPNNNGGSKNGNAIGSRNGMAKLKPRDGSASGSIGVLGTSSFASGDSLMPTVKMMGRTAAGNQFAVDRGRVTLGNPAVPSAGGALADIIDIGRGGGAVCSEELWAAAVFPASTFVDVNGVAIGDRLLVLDRALREAYAASQLIA